MSDPDINKNNKIDSLPEAVNAIKDIERKLYALDKPKAQTSVNTTQPNSVKSRFGFRNFKKMGVILIACFIAAILLPFIFIYTDIDTRFITLRLEGNVVEETTLKPISDAEIYVNGEVITTSDIDGAYSLGNLKPGKYNIKIVAQGYKILEEEVSVGRTFMNYTTFKDFTLTTAQYGTLSGRFIADSSSYNYFRDTLTIDNNKYTINSDGTFKIEKVETGKRTIIFSSTNFKDIESEIEIVAGSNQLKDLVLVPSGDVVNTVKSYVKEDLVSNINIEIENVDKKQINISEDGMLRIKDLEVGKDYKLDISLNGYNSRSYNFTIKQGENVISEFRIVEEGKAAYIGETEDLGNQIFISDFDGENSKQLTSLRNLKPFGQYFDSQNNTIYFLTEVDRTRNVNGDNVPLVYSTDLSGNLTKVTKDGTKLGLLFPNYKAKKMINAYFDKTDNKRYLQVLDLEGNLVLKIKEYSNKIISYAIISNDSRYVYFNEYDNATDKYTLYRVVVDNNKIDAITTSNDIELLDVSENGARVLYTTENNNTNFIDLVYTDVATNQTKVIKQNYQGQQFNFIEGSNDTVIYFLNNRDNVNRIFLLDIISNSETSLIELDANQSIKYVYQESDHIYYITNQGMHIFNLDTPRLNKTVNVNVFSYTGYKFVND